MALLSVAQAALLRTTFDRVFLNHVFTRTTYVDGSPDEWGTPSRTPVVTAGVPCKYNPAQAGRTDQFGNSIAYAPTLVVSHSDPLTEGDEVTAITDPGDGTVFVAGPLTVATVIPLAGLGPELQRQATLKAGKVTD